MRNPFKPPVAAPLSHSLNPALREAEIEAAVSAQRLAKHRHDEETARLLCEAARLTAARKR